jgi:hypothetical protein
MFGLVCGLPHHLVSLVWINKINGLDGVVSIIFSFMYGLVWFWGGSQTIGSLTSDRNKENMDAYCLEVRKLKNKFYGLEFHHVVCNNNVAADVLSKLGSTRAQVPAGVFVHELHAPSIPEPAPATTDTAPSQAGHEVMMIDVD